MKIDDLFDQLERVSPTNATATATAATTISKTRPTATDVDASPSDSNLDASLRLKLISTIDTKLNVPTFRYSFDISRPNALLSVQLNVSTDHHDSSESGTTSNDNDNNINKELSVSFSRLPRIEFPSLTLETFPNPNHTATKVLPISVASNISPSICHAKVDPCGALATVNMPSPTVSDTHDPSLVYRQQYWMDWLNGDEIGELSLPEMLLPLPTAPAPSLLTCRRSFDGHVNGFSETFLEPILSGEWSYSFELQKAGLWSFLGGMKHPPTSFVSPTTNNPRSTIETTTHRRSARNQETSSDAARANEPIFPYLQNVHLSDKEIERSSFTIPSQLLNVVDDAGDALAPLNQGIIVDDTLDFKKMKEYESELLMMTNRKIHTQEKNNRNEESETDMAKSSEYTAGSQLVSSLDKFSDLVNEDDYDYYVAKARSEADRLYWNTDRMQTLSLSTVLADTEWYDWFESNTNDGQKSANDTSASPPQPAPKFHTTVASALQSPGISEEDRLLLSDVDVSKRMTSTLSNTEGSVAPKRRKQWSIMDKTDVSRFYQEIPTMAMLYPFELDHFQKQAVLHLERGDSVFVAAHTSAGKTAVAEYAIALAQKNLTRVVYTSPIKTLSNQKFRDFRRTFGEENIGLVTGDVSIQPEAPCVIMTTEILRSMLYRGSDMLRDLSFVVFDEIHYINDLERGVVWEEVLILLPPHVQLIMLSATVPNTLEFADWVGRIQQKLIYVISTEKRPVPLQHYLWCKGKMHNYLDGTGRFNTLAFKNAREEGMTDKRRAMEKKGLMRRSGKNEWSNLIQYLRKQELLPVVIFSFSKRMCEDSANSLFSADLTTSSEKSSITVFANAALSRLHSKDRTLPQIRRIVELARRGVGVHHAGMLPILKELVEMIFSRGLIKVLFATETFAMGVNSPTKTVCFNGLRKHDGAQFRDLTPSEYTQMAGRAGRRGLDTFGVVMVICKHDEVPDEETVRQMSIGKPLRLQSRFRLTYNMILNLSRQEDMHVEDMIRRSFGESFLAKEEPEKKELLALTQAKFNSLPPLQCIHCDKKDLSEFSTTYQALRTFDQQLYKLLFTTPSIAPKAFQVGRVMLINKADLQNMIAAIVRISDSSNNYHRVDELEENPTREVMALLLLPVAVSTTSKSRSDIVFTGQTRSFHYAVAKIKPIDVEGFLQPLVRVDGNAIWLDKNVSKIESALQELKTIYDKNSKVTPWSSGKPILSVLPSSKASSTSITLDILSELRLTATDGAMMDIVSSAPYRKNLLSTLASSPISECPYLLSHLTSALHVSAITSRIERLKESLQDENLFLLADFQHRLSVLTTLRYLNDDRTVLLKGRVACEINTCDSLIGAELIFENVLTDLTAEEIVSLLSCLVFQETCDDEIVLPDRLQASLSRFQSMTLSLGHVMVKCGLDIVPSEFVKASINPGLMAVVYAWSQGVPFSEIVSMTTVLEGSIVRCILRLEETCRDMKCAARVIGNRNLYEKINRGGELIKRDIIFAASLYCT